jgi:hypothetical protein
VDCRPELFAKFSSKPDLPKNNFARFNDAIMTFFSPEHTLAEPNASPLFFPVA